VVPVRQDRSAEWHAIPAAEEESDPAEFAAMLEEAVRGLYAPRPALDE
jgi:hypothetical protein